MIDYKKKDMDELENRMRTMDWYRDHLHDMEAIAPDTHGCDCIFLDCLLTEEMESDFPYIAHDFLKHRMADIILEQKEVFLPEEPDYSFPVEIMRNTLLNIMYSDAKNGNDYSRELFRTLYRTYYRREYQQLKRFRTLSASEVISLAEGDEEDYEIGAMARILSIGRMFDIEIQADCSYIYHVLNSNWKRRREEWEAERNERYDHRLNLECQRQAEEWMSGVSSPYYKAKELKPYREAQEMMGKFFQAEGMPADYARICRMYPTGYTGEFAHTLYTLRLKYPRRENITFEEVQRLSAYYVCTEALTDTALCVAEFFSECLVPHDPDSGWTDHADMFRPEKMNIPQTQKKNVPVSAAPVVRRVSEDVPGQERDLQTAIEEVEQLRKRLRQKDEELRHLHHQLEAEKKETLAARADSEKAAEDREELISLREHVYYSTEQELFEAETGLEEMEQLISEERIVIIGGHSNWTYKLRNRFRNWVFLDPKTSGSVDGNLLNKADRVFFFTEIISHSTYYRFIKLVREREIPFGYIHSINIENNIRQIYKEVTAEK